MGCRVRSIACFLVVLVAGTASAQADRYELGRRLKQFEAAWEAQPDPAARKRALAIVPAASMQFLSFQLGDAARTLDSARLALLSDEPITDERLFLESLAVTPETRVVASGRKELILTLKSVYPVKAPVAEGLTVRISFAGKIVELKPEKLPAKLTLPLDHLAAKKSFDGPIEVSIERGKQALKWTVDLSLIEHFESRLTALKMGKLETPTLESASVAERYELLSGLINGVPQETDLPAASLLDEAELIANSGLNKPFYTANRDGQFRLAVPTSAKDRTACRLFVPKGLDPKKPVPLVVALHGAGGSENLFFEGYGGGHIVKECEERGWLLVSPRSVLLGGSPPVPAIVAKLAERYPIDLKRVFLVGHSMGAGQAVELVQQSPGAYAGLAVLGGAGRIRKPEAFATLPTFIGVGTQDFALNGSRSLAKALTQANAKGMTAKEYPDLEHLIIVREALPDAFSMFDRVRSE